MHHNKNDKNNKKRKIFEIEIDLTSVSIGRRWNGDNKNEENWKYHFQI
jgi:hypothetical protein